MSEAVEINFDGLVGPTHNYSGLSEGNLASKRNEGLVSRPRDAALQGLAKMRKLAAMGLAQGVLPPHERPNIGWLRTLGFSGGDREVWSKAWKDAPALARASAASSAMWAANAATVSPSADCADGRINVTVANLLTMLHRAQEAPVTERVLRALLPEEDRFAIHPALPAHAAFSDEGAANHMRMSAAAGRLGVEIFVYGRDGDDARPGFPARQTLEACKTIARRHGLDPARTVFARQAPEAIDAGAFHNDVVAVAHETVLLHHEQSFAHKDAVFAEIRAKAAGLFEPQFVEVRAADVSLQDAVSAYLFNSQLVRRPNAGALTLIAPVEARENNRTASVIAALTAQQGAPIGAVDFVDVRESMRNGGGPACLRLRIVMTAQERAAASPGFFLTDPLGEKLENWISSHYREQLAGDDLKDPKLIDETRAALDALTAILPLGARFYDFQRG